MHDIGPKRGFFMSEPLGQDTVPDTDEQDEAATGDRTVIDDTEELPDDDVNVAAGQGDYDHEAQIGDPVDDDESAEVDRLVAATAGDDEDEDGGV